MSAVKTRLRCLWLGLEKKVGLNTVLLWNFTGAEWGAILRDCGAILWLLPHKNKRKYYYKTAEAV